ncbi:Esterase [Forsythia ovata]|uniref:Esterase n=1 Tax=Forsythia ovata TaxID=205694 RepID=A0ABD1UWQ9_9LAMI
MVKGVEEMTFLPPCNYPAIYNFGDSNSDTGGLAAAFFFDASTQWQDVLPQASRLTRGNRRLPRPEDFSKALFTIDIGQNEIAAAISNKNIEFLQVTVPKIVSQFKAQVCELYKNGVRTFWIHNTGAIGCLLADENGCAKSHNDMARHFNKHPEGEILKLRQIFPQLR